MIDFRQLVQAGLHFGHQKSRWCPKMAPYIWGYRNGVHLIDVSKIAFSLEKAAAFLESVAASGDTILWVGTKKASKNLVAELGKNLKMPYVNHRWVGGTITNFYQVKKAVTKLLHYEDIVEKAEDTIYTKKERVVFQKHAERLKKTVGGLTELKMPVGALVLIDVRKEQTALLEAVAANVPVVALVDSNADPSGVDYVIPGNDDSPKGIKLILDYLSAAVKRGKEKKNDAATAQEIAEHTGEPVKADAKKVVKKAAAKKTTEKAPAKAAAKKEAKAPAKKAEKAEADEKPKAKAASKK